MSLLRFRDRLYNESAQEIKRYADEAFRYLTEAQTAQRHLSALLALIHEDRGEREELHGTDTAIAEAKNKIKELLAIRDSAKIRAIWGSR